MPYAHSDKTQLTVDDVRARLKLEGGKRLVMHTTFEPAGDQPTAIEELSTGVMDGEQDQVLAALVADQLEVVLAGE